MWKFKDDLNMWKEMEVKVMNLLNWKWFNLIENPNEREMDLIIIEKWIEVKYDIGAKRTWNFYIEFECNWTPSWLFRKEQIMLQYWAQTDWDNVFLVEWRKLKRWVLQKINECKWNKSLTSKWARLIEAGWNWWRTKWLVVPVWQIEELSSFIYPIEE